MANRESFVFYLSQYEAIADLSNEQLGRLFRAIFEKQLGKEVVLKNDIKIAFNFINNQMVVDNERYLKKCETLRANAQKGGAPKGNKNALKQPKQPNCKKNNLNDNDNVNDNDLYICNNSDKSSLLLAQSSNNVDSELFIQIPLIDKNMFPVYESDIKKWQEIYPAVDIKQEFRNMLGWCNSNPKNRKTKNGINRFINSWLSRRQDNSRVERNSTLTEVERSSTPTKPINVERNSTLKTSSDNTTHKIDIEAMTDEELANYVNGGGI